MSSELQEFLRFVGEKPKGCSGKEVSKAYPNWQQLVGELETDGMVNREWTQHQGKTPLSTDWVLTITGLGRHFL